MGMKSRRIIQGNEFDRTTEEEGNYAKIKFIRASSGQAQGPAPTIILFRPQRPPRPPKLPSRQLGKLGPALHVFIELFLNLVQFVA